MTSIFQIKLALHCLSGNSYSVIQRIQLRDVVFNVPPYYRAYHSYRNAALTTLISSLRYLIAAIIN